MPIVDNKSNTAKQSKNGEEETHIYDSWQTMAPKYTQEDDTITRTGKETRQHWWCIHEMKSSCNRNKTNKMESRSRFWSRKALHSKSMHWYLLAIEVLKRRKSIKTQSITKGFWFKIHTMLILTSNRNNKTEGSHRKLYQSRKVLDSKSMQWKKSLLITKRFGFEIHVITCNKFWCSHVCKYPLAEIR